MILHRIRNSHKILAIDGTIEKGGVCIKNEGSLSISFLSQEDLMYLTTN